MLAKSVDKSGLQMSILGMDSLVPVGLRDHPLAWKARVPHVELLMHELVGLTPGGAIDDHFAGHARRLGLNEALQAGQSLRGTVPEGRC